MTNKFKALLIVIACFLLVPSFGVFTWQVVENKYESDFIESVAKQFNVSTDVVISKQITLAKLCNQSNTPSELSVICSYEDEINLLKLSSIYTLATGVFLILFVVGSRWFIGLDRKKLASLFSPITTISMLILAVAIVVQGIILVYSIYILGVVFTEHIYPKILLLVGLSALISAYVLIASIISTLKNRPTLIYGHLVDEENGSELIKLVKEVAEKVGATPPENIVIGLEPNFYVTASAIQIAGENRVLNNTTMYLSLPFLSIFSKEELISVIGHELGHFKGEDTYYSMRFYPAYSKLYRALEGMSQQANGQSSAGMFAIPCAATLKFILNEFSITERTIGRGREFEADKVGASIGGSLSLITALMKVSEYAPVWNELRRFNIDKLSEGVFFNNLAGIYCEATTSKFESLDFDKSKDDLFKSQMSHLTDTHPTLSERMTSLNINASELNREQLKPANILLDSYIKNIDKLNESLSLLEHRLMVALGLVIIPEPSEG